MRIRKTLRSHIFQAAKNRELMLVNNHLGAFKKNSDSRFNYWKPGNCPSNILHHQYILKFSSQTVKVNDGC